ncbi:hypothetical protein Fmac_017965 [Flemingia macrophylla]|uniref:Disease resistance protein At4g27190-like leucine-rich repeats domain-containing protein n=1 Tax=Flemingia macrophylla TaxID=520843 RepID=A0ABD1M3N1_9FABA
MKEVRLNKPAFSDNFFGSLKKMEFDAASKRDIVIPSHVLPYLRSLEELHVHSCGAAVVIFEIDDGEATKAMKAIAFRLKKLTLQDLENLKCVWSRNPKGIVSFPNLKGVVVEYCGRLTTLFPLSLARNLVKLKTLRIHKCEKLVEIVEIEDAMEHGTAEMFEFPCLFALTLWNLPLLRCFYPGNLYLECPILESLEVSICPKLKLFASEFDHEPPISMQEQSLFSVEKIVPKLKMLTVNKEIIILLSDARFPKELLFNLNVLDLCFEDDDNKKDTLPFDFLHKVPGVEHLKVRGGIGVKEIFPSHGEILGKLNILTLDFLPKLESIGLEYLSAVSFINLKQLMVSNCQKMEYLFTFSTAKSLVQLMSLDIQNCKSIKEIVKKEDEDALDMIIFGRLQELRLDSIQRLVSFYSGNATLQFPCLRQARITECPNMKTFSDGIINNAPMFCGIQTSEDVWDLQLHDDLNTTIQLLHQEQVEKFACDIQHFKFGDYPFLEEIWQGVVPIPSGNSFNNLKSLIVVECESLSNVIPFYLLRFLCNLKEIEVSNCKSVETIFDVKDTDEADIKPASQISLPLKKVILNQLPNLEHLWNLNPVDEILSLQELQDVYISNCQSLKSLFPTSVANHLVKLEVKNCARLTEIFVPHEADLKGTTKQLKFHSLNSLTLRELPDLKNFYHEKHLLEWPMLKCLDIYHCDMLKLFTSEHHSGEVPDVEDQLDASIDQQSVFSSVEKVLPNLVQLSFKEEDAMAISRGYEFQVMPSLEYQANTGKDNMIGRDELKCHPGWAVIAPPSI